MDLQCGKRKRESEDLDVPKETEDLKPQTTSSGDSSREKEYSSDEEPSFPGNIPKRLAFSVGIRDVYPKITITIIRQRHLCGALVTLPLLKLKPLYDEITTLLKDTFGWLIGQPLPTNYIYFRKHWRECHKITDPMLKPLKGLKNNLHFVDIFNREDFPPLAANGVKVFEMELWGNNYIAETAVNTLLRFFGEDPHEIDTNRPRIPKYQPYTVQPSQIKVHFAPETETTKLKRKKYRRNPNYERRERALTTWQQATLAEMRSRQSFCNSQTRFSDPEYDSISRIRAIRLLWETIYAVSNEIDVNKFDLPIQCSRKELIAVKKKMAEIISWQEKTKVDPSRSKINEKQAGLKKQFAELRKEQKSRSEGSRNDDDTEDEIDIGNGEEEDENAGEEENGEGEDNDEENEENGEDNDEENEENGEESSEGEENGEESSEGEENDEENGEESEKEENNESEKEENNNEDDDDESEEEDSSEGGTETLI